MLRSDANDQSKVPYQLVYQTPSPPVGEERPNPLTGEGSSYQPKVQSSPLPGEEPTQVTYREYPPLWNTGSKLVTAPSVKPSARGVRTASILAFTVVMAMIFGVGLFAGWDFSRNAASSTNANFVPPLQS